MTGQVGEVRVMEIKALDVAKAYRGIHERAGELDNPYIQAWLLECGFEDAHDEVPWCSAFVHGVLKPFGKRVPVSGSARARSWMGVGRRITLEEAKPGWDIVIFQRGGGDQPGVENTTAQGHVAFFVERLPDGFVRVLGGNQSDKVCLADYPASRVLTVQRLYEE